MTKDEIQFWMLIAFLAAAGIGFYKVYFLFNTPVEGLDTRSQHEKLQTMIIDLIMTHTNARLDKDTLFEILIQHDDLKDDTYKNFNRNRYNQLLQQLYYRFDVDNLEHLIRRIQNEKKA